jgi:hypothetical protein
MPTQLATAERAASGSLESSYRSPKRCLIQAFRKSRNQWKLKAQQRNRQLKVLKVRVRDLEHSREHHAQQAQVARAALRQAEQKVAQLQAEGEQLRARLQESPQAVEKKAAWSN